MSDHLNPSFLEAESTYRRARVARGVAASRAGRSRASWLRRVAASDPTLPTRRD